ncbi:hypothetical protein JHL17_13865 [Azospirillum sp. YIM B02556]|uniref:Uncharacterized protein n=1 Tax=Azospirillum endophyticum TaxID=2800326 RepID=A0ABS1F5E4_9PROT|nr:hypothetical protein [Azospirillum endophyticum]MBK1838502.1 hypothetical protein [Azospirillum endophyticum]
MRRLAVMLLCLILATAVSIAGRPASAFEVQSGGIPLSAVAVAVLANRVGTAPPAQAGTGSAFPPWMGGGRTGAGAMGVGTMATGLPGAKGAGLPPAGRPAGMGVPDRAAMNEQLFGIKR